MMVVTMSTVLLVRTTSWCRRALTPKRIALLLDGLHVQVVGQASDSLART